MAELKELQQKLADLQKRKFMLEMADHWDAEDYRLDRQLSQQIAEVTQKIEELEK